MAITKDQIEYQIGANTKQLVGALDDLMSKTIGLDGATDNLQGSMKDLSKTQKEYADAISKANANSAEGTRVFEDLNSTADQLTESMAATNTILQAMNLPENELLTFNTAMQAVTNSVNLFKASITVFGSVKAAFDAVFNPQTIELANKLLYILQAYAMVKGFDKLADSIETARNKLNLLSEAVDKFRLYASQGFMETIDRTAGVSKGFVIASAITSAAIATITAAFVALSGYSIFKTISQDGMNLGKIISGLGNTFRSVFTGISDNITKAGSTFAGFKLSLQDIKLSIADLYKLFAVGGLSLGSLASGLAENELAAMALVSALNWSSAAFLAFSIAIKLVLVAIGSFIESIGDKLISAMDSFAEKFAKTQQVAVQFGFVIANFGKAYGAEFIGTLAQWEAQIQSLAKTTNFSGNDLRKSTKLIVAENQALGLSYTENVKFLDRAVDIAASSGLELLDVVQRLQSALLGNSTAVGALGINLSSHAIEHSKLNQTMQKTVGTMTSMEKQQIALAEIYRQTEPLVGAAIKQGETIIGINQQIANSYGSIQSKIGSVNVLSIALSKTYAALLKTVEGLPNSFFAVFGGLTDLLGVTFKVVGITIQWLLIIGGLTTAYKLFNIAIATNLAFQGALNAAFAKLGLSMAINITAVTSAATAFTVLGTILKGGFMLIMANVGRVLLAVTMKVLALTGAILVNPLFLGGMAIALGVAAVVKALQELNDEFQIVQLSMGEFSDISKMLEGVFSVLGTVLSGTFNAFVQSIKIIVLSMGQLYHYAVIAGAALGKLFNPKESDGYNKNIDASLDKLDTLTAAHEKSLDSMAYGFLGANEKIALNAKYLTEAGKATDDLTFKQLQLQKASAAIDMNTIRIDILGTEVQKLTNRYTIATKEVEKFSKEIISSTDINTEAIKSYQQALEDQASAGFQLDKMRIDSLKGLSDIMKDVQKGSMKNNEDETKAIIAGFDERREAVKEFEKVLANLGPISTEAASKIKAAYATIAQAQKEALNASQKKREDEAIAETVKVIKEEADALKTIADRNRDISKAIAGERLTAQQKIVSDLQIELESLDERLYLERASRGNNSEIVKALELQKILLTQNAEVQKRMTDMELPDWIDQLGVALEKAFAFDAAQNFFSFIENSMKRINNSELVVNIKQKITETKESLGMGDGGAVSDGMSSVGDAVMKAGEVAKEAGGALISGIAQAGGWVGAVIDVIMNADKYLSALIEFPKQFLQVILKLPELVQTFIDQFPGMIAKIAEALPGLILKLVDMIPNFIAALLDALPLLIERLAEAIPELFVKIVGMMPKLFAMIVRAMFLAIQSLVKGLIRGISNVLKGVKMPRVKIETKGIEKIGAKLAGSASRLFQVKDLTEAAKDPIKKMTEMIGDSFKKGNNLTKNAWQWVMDKIIQPIFAGLKAVWMFVWEKIIMPIYEGFKAIFNWINDNIFKPIINAFMSAFKWINDNIFQPIISGLMTVFTWVNDNIFKPFTEAIMTVFTWINDNIIQPIAAVFMTVFSFIQDNVIKPLQSIGEKIAKPITDAFAGIMSIFNSIGDALKSLFKLDFSGLKEAMREVFSKGGEMVKNAFKGVVNPIIKMFNGLIDLLNALVIPGVSWSVSAGRLGSWSGTLFDDIDLLPGTIGKLQTFAQGGLVQSSSNPISGFGTDTVPTMLTPGEFVMSRPAVQSIGLDNLRAMNSGSSPGGTNNYNMSFSIKVEAKTTMDEGYIRATLIPRMSEELKRASLDGKFVLSQKGIR